LYWLLLVVDLLGVLLLYAGNKLAFDIIEKGVAICSIFFWLIYLIFMTRS
jgi:hypothetical protein